MTGDPFDDPQWKRYAEHAREELVPMIENSTVTVSVVPPDTIIDPKFALELGYMIMLDKPIIAVVSPGSKVPPKLAKVADAIVEGPISAPDFKERFTAAIDRVTKKWEG